MLAQLDADAVAMGVSISNAKATWEWTRRCPFLLFSAASGNSLFVDTYRLPQNELALSGALPSIPLRPRRLGASRPGFEQAFIPDSRTMRLPPRSAYSVALPEVY